MYVKMHWKSTGPPQESPATPPQKKRTLGTETESEGKNVNWYRSNQVKMVVKPCGARKLARVYA